MNGVPRLQHLPVPAATAGAPAVVQPGAGGGREVRPVAPVTPAHYRETERGQGRAAVDEGARGRPQRELPRGRLAAEEAAGSKPVSFSRLTSMPFMVQLLGQQAAAGRSQGAGPQTSLTGHRDAALLGSDVYRRSGGEPELLPEGATFVRLAV